MNVEDSVLERYTQGAQEREEALCCPVDYDSSLLAMLPQEIIERDYGCGDPSRYVREGDVVLDLGSGGGKICYMAAQLVGKNGQVIGVDMNDDMLALARRHQSDMAVRLGSDRVTFHKGNIQDLALDIDALAQYLATHPASSHADYLALKQWEHRQRREQPMIADASVDLVISNCVLNLVADHEKQQLVQEIFRVLKPGGRVAISDIVSDHPVNAEMKQDKELWSGCISGAFQEREFLETFAAASFDAVCYDKWDAQPWRVINDIEFRSVTLTAVRPEQGKETAHTKSLMYRGPFAAVIDEAGDTWQRGQRVTVSASTHERLTQPGYGDAFINLSPGDSEACCPPSSDTSQACCTPEPVNGGGCC
ncbi:MAG: methyltransferase domain-containing protein [Gammaproteobacteria bacterium]|nr:methyltransferase domain-containing protein [Gammaproteobacteria bacterium]